MKALHEALAALGLAVTGLAPLAGDASQRRYVRVALAAGGSVVACLYPPGGEGQAARDEQVQRWGWERALPIPQPLGRHGLVTVSADLGDEDLARGMERLGEGVLSGALEALAAFQACGFATLSTPPFDAAFFRRELAGFERYTTAGTRVREVTSAWLDELAERLQQHPARLVHRDFHANNLLLSAGRTFAIDYQDMRGGPDTYDAASLLRERAGARVVDEWAWLERAAARLVWEPGWRTRYLECAAQRGLKVIGTFRRLAAEGKPLYLEWLPDVGRRTHDALEALSAAVEVRAAVDSALISEGV